MFWPGVSGKFMRFLPVTVFTVLSGSLLYALIFGPSSAPFLARLAAPTNAPNISSTLENGDPRTLNRSRFYARVRGVATRYGLITMIGTITILFSTVWAYGQYGSGLIYFSDGENKFAMVNLRARGNLSVDETNELLREVEERVLQVEGIAHVNAYTELSGRPSRDGGTDRIGSVFLELYDRSDRRMNSKTVLEEVRALTKTLSGCKSSCSLWTWALPPAKTCKLNCPLTTGL